MTAPTPADAYSQGVQIRRRLELANIDRHLAHIAATKGPHHDDIDFWSDKRSALVKSATEEDQ